MSKVKVIDTFVSCTNDVVSMDVDTVFIFWKNEGLRNVSVKGDKPRETVTSDARNFLVEYNSPMYAIDTVLPLINGFVRKLAFPVVFDCGTNLYIGKGMRNAYSVDAKATSVYSDGSTPVLIINPNIFGNSRYYVDCFDRRKVGYNLVKENGRCIPYGYVIMGVADYLYEVCVKGKLRGLKKSNLPFEVKDKDAFIDLFVTVYETEVFNNGLGSSTPTYKMQKAELLSFIGNVVSIDNVLRL